MYSYKLHLHLHFVIFLRSLIFSIITSANNSKGSLIVFNSFFLIKPLSSFLVTITDITLGFTYIITIRFLIVKSFYNIGIMVGY